MTANEGYQFYRPPGNIHFECPSYLPAARHSKMVPKVVCYSDHSTYYNHKIENDKRKHNLDKDGKWCDMLSSIELKSKKGG
jgi:hypothetical protein